MSVALANTAANLSGKTAVLAEADQTITGLQTFDRGTNPPFAVGPAVAGKVVNLDADKLDGLDAAVFARVDGGENPSGRIKFPAAQVASGDPNTLDDYEEGGWVPVIGGTTGTSGQTYAEQSGFYTKI